MNYTMKVAENDKVAVDLCKSGNLFTVGVWSKEKHLMESILDFKFYEDAYHYFLQKAQLHGVENAIRDVKHDPSDFNFD